MPGDISINRKALRDYHIIERFEAGLELKGTEVKSIRAGHVQLAGAFARVEGGQAFVYGLEIKTYEKASHTQHEPQRQRRLLLHRKEIERLQGLTQVKGHTVVALRLYWKGARVKAELGVGKGKEQADIRSDLKEKATKREVDREIARFNKRNL